MMLSVNAFTCLLLRLSDGLLIKRLPLAVRVCVCGCAHACTWPCTYMLVHIHGHAHTCSCTYMPVHIHGHAHTWLCSCCTHLCPFLLSISALSGPCDSCPHKYHTQGMLSAFVPPRRSHVIYLFPKQRGIFLPRYQNFSNYSISIYQVRLPMRSTFQWISKTPVIVQFPWVWWL